MRIQGGGPRPTAGMCVPAQRLTHRVCGYGVCHACGYRACRCPAEPNLCYTLCVRYSLSKAVLRRMSMSRNLCRLRSYRVQPVLDGLLMRALADGLTQDASDKMRTP